MAWTPELRALAVVKRRTHGHAGLVKTPEYTAWSHAKQRTTNPTTPDGPGTVGAGSGCAPKWLHDYARSSRTSPNLLYIKLKI